jgi:signal transduction histidine kinase
MFDCDKSGVSKHTHETWSGEEEIAIQAASGAALPIFVSLSTISTGKERLFILIIRDLTEQKRLEREREEIQARLARSEKISALGRMAAQVAHEVRNPLAGLSLYSLHLKSKMADKASDNELSLVDKIVSTVDRLSNTVEQVLSFARPITLVRRPVDHHRLIKDALQLLEPQLKTNNVAVKLRLDESQPLVVLDEASIHSTLINLMLNSIQAMNKGGELAIASARDAEALLIEITDTGCGMNQEQIKNIFEPFYTTKSHGLGLGMFYAEKTIKQHGGSIIVESETGKGTSMKISLPTQGDSNYAATS